MLELISLLETSGQTVRSDFRRWFTEIPVAANWTVASDYSVGNKNKKSDAFSFVIMPKHDTDQNIASWISAFAPKDIKATRKPSDEFLDYFCAPVTFSYNFVVERESNYLKAAITVEAMQTIAKSLQEVVGEWKSVEPGNEQYYSSLDSQLQKLLDELSSKNPSTGLLRKMFLVASFGALVFYIIHEEKSPLSIRWISDRDAMFDRHDGLAFDLAWLLFQIMRRRSGGVIDVRRPQLIFTSPLMDGVNKHDEFVRLPDYLAGTLADLRLPNVMFSHPKFPTIFNKLFVDASNNAIIEIVAPTGRITTRRLAFGNPPEGAKTMRHHE
ncbi:hypothetical protein HKX54_15050 [Sulfitobacter sp. M57]|uniref:hypothetical protein n=1 Tax=unclassified Sulfitobacter TaxID=196795 RepID=UPI0023E2E0B5|nr:MULTISPECIES: hypothetical protein [unclassified Sulfitobacter]MDF3415788.1 hypothetical protein [Sulfitobacter sp. KE5]MDF3423268.1 hypothetical protein [Sulfitobacter sp. KE43]MDF3434334.1 hypothetical protein [Sulfitobacter sp. KE42]MDF3459633.1 hypothetical protein [Sulfitobacter sp. S74]MDF3463872.1 hypothetical protein [Sulfitobacter sp. Ks18]